MTLSRGCTQVLLSTQTWFFYRLMVREGHYLDCVATVGQFEHKLSTDLLNHLVLVQKVFVKVSTLTTVISCATLELDGVVGTGNYVGSSLSLID